MTKILNRLANVAMPVRLSEAIYTRDRDIDVDYESLDYEIHIPTLNEEDYIEDTLQSLYIQDPVQNGDVGLILIDSYSTDDTVNIAREYVDDVLFSPRGILTARNMGIEESKPDVVISADAGDIYSKGWVDEMAKPFEDDNVVAAFGNIYSKDPLFTRPQKIKHSIVNTWNLPGNNSAVRTSVLQEVGNFETDLDQQELIQVLLEKQITKKFQFSVMGKVAYRPHAAMYKSQRRKMLSGPEHNNYKRQKEEGIRF